METGSRFYFIEKEVADFGFYQHLKKEGVPEGKMRDDMEIAFERLIGKDTTYVFGSSTPPQHIILVSGKNKKHSSDLRVRIDRQEIFEKEFDKKKRKFANVQIQLNKLCFKAFKVAKGNSTTVAQVHFECNVEIPKHDIKKAFRKSCSDKKSIYVLTKE